MENAWTTLSREQKELRGVMNDRIIMRFSRFLDWNLLSSHYEFSINMLRMYQHKVNWSILLTKQKFPDHLLREMVSYFDNS